MLRHEGGLPDQERTSAILRRLPNRHHVAPQLRAQASRYSWMAQASCENRLLPTVGSHAHSRMVMAVEAWAARRSLHGYEGG